MIIVKLKILMKFWCFPTFLYVIYLPMKLYGPLGLLSVLFHSFQGWLRLWARLMCLKSVKIGFMPCKYNWGFVTFCSEINNYFGIWNIRVPENVYMISILKQILLNSAKNLKAVVVRTWHYPNIFLLNWIFIYVLWSTNYKSRIE